MNLGRWLRDYLDPARLPSRVKMCANAMAHFLDIRTGVGQFTQEQLGRRIGIKDLKEVRKLINAVVAARLIAKGRKGRKGEGGTRYMLTAPDEQYVADGDMLDFESTGGAYPPLTEEDQAPDDDPYDEIAILSRGYVPPTLSKELPTELKITTPPSPPGDQGGGGDPQPQLEPEPPVAPPAPTAPVSAPPLPEPQPTPDNPPAATTAPPRATADDFRGGAETLSLIGPLWDLTGEITSPELVEIFAVACAGGWDPKALAAHMANNPPNKPIRDPVALLHTRLRLRPLPPGPGACSCAGCERWRRHADAAPPAPTARRPGDLYARLGAAGCPEHDGHTQYTPSGLCAVCLDREEAELADQPDRRRDTDARPVPHRRALARAGVA